MIKNIAFKLFGKLALEYAHSFFSSIETDIRKSGLEYTLEEYFAITLFYTLISLLASIPLLFLFFSNILKIDILISFLISYILSFLVAILVFFMFYLYPSIRSLLFARELEKEFLVGIYLMAAVSSGFKNPLDVFEKVANFRTLKAFSKVMRDIVRLVRYRGYSLPYAILEFITLVLKYCKSFFINFFIFSKNVFVIFLF